MFQQVNIRPKTVIYDRTPLAEVSNENKKGKKMYKKGVRRGAPQNQKISSFCFKSFSHDNCWANDVDMFEYWDVGHKREKSVSWDPQYVLSNPLQSSRTQLTHLKFSNEILLIEFVSLCTAKMLAIFVFVLFWNLYLCVVFEEIWGVGMTNIRGRFLAHWSVALAERGVGRVAIVCKLSSPRLFSLQPPAHTLPCIIQLILARIETLTPPHKMTWNTILD